ncbi:hypothetical protein [Vibrio natriegens]|uniref:hypothetical protein n=1 Tax=Vibrio natriegens TaxID=691 RepID=UPI000804383F|nr:hypothetical protein [Vibrio natriegens]ANQ16286.1 hypothetical protein BA891_03155 [Vibrio natriegens]
MNKETHLNALVTIKNSASCPLPIIQESLLHQAVIVLKDVTEKESITHVISKRTIIDEIDNCLNLGTIVIDLETLIERVTQIGIDYFNYTAGYKSPQRNLISRGFLAALLDFYGNRRHTVNEAMILFVGLENNNDPLRQLSRYRKAFDEFISTFLSDMRCIYDEDATAIRKQLMYMLQQYFEDALIVLKSKTTMIDSVLCDKFAESLRNLATTPAPKATEHIIDEICRQYLPRFCPH